MKARLQLTRLLIVGSLLFGVSCSQETENDPAPLSALKTKADIQEQNGFLVFKDRSIFEDAIHKIGEVPAGMTVEQHLNKWESKYNFSSMRTKVSYHKKLQGNTQNARMSDGSDLIEDEFFASMVSPEGLIQIGDWIFKIDLKNEKVYALPAINSDLVAALKQEQPNDAKIRVFSTNDDVLDMLENGFLGKSSADLKASSVSNLFCRDSSAESHKDEDPVQYDTDRRLDCKVVYQKAGVYFSLQAKVQSQNRFAGIWYAQQDNLHLEFDAMWDPKCRDTQYDRGYESESDNELNHRAYSSTRGLHHYQYSVIFGNNIVESRVFQIQDL